MPFSIFSSLGHQSFTLNKLTGVRLSYSIGIGGSGGIGANNGSNGTATTVTIQSGITGVTSDTITSNGGSGGIFCGAGGAGGTAYGGAVNMNGGSGTSVTAADVGGGGGGGVGTSNATKNATDIRYGDNGADAIDVDGVAIPISTYGYGPTTYGPSSGGAGSSQATTNGPGGNGTGWGAGGGGGTWWGGNGGNGSIPGGGGGGAGGYTTFTGGNGGNGMIVLKITKTDNTSTIVLLTTGNSYKVPPAYLVGLASIKIWAIGAGGGGAGATTDTTAGGGGGAGGASAKTYFPDSDTTNVNYIRNYNFATPPTPTNAYSYYFDRAPIVGWSFSSSGAYVIGNGDGGGFGFETCPYEQFLICQCNTGSTSNFSTTASQSIKLLATTYTLSFWAAVRKNAATYSTGNQFSIKIDGTTFYTSSFTASNTPWVKYTGNFISTSVGSHTLSIVYVAPVSVDSSIGITQIVTNCSFVNYNFALPALSANTFAYYTANAINNWNNVGVSGFAIANGNAFGPFGTCPYTQFLVNQGGDSRYSSISQSVYLSATTYTLSFWAAVRTGLYTPGHQFTITIDGNINYTSSFTTSSTTWTQYTFDFTVLSTGYKTISFNFNNTLSSNGVDTSIGITQILIYHNNKYTADSTGIYNTNDLITHSNATISTVGQYTLYTFKSGTGSITFNSSTVASVLLVGGGAGGGGAYSNWGEGAGGGGAGAVGYGTCTFGAGTYNITVGDGGLGGIYNGIRSTSGQNSSITSSSINETAYGGGFGGGGGGQQGGVGGSGGGSYQNSTNGGYTGNPTLTVNTASTYSSPSANAASGVGSLTYLGNSGGYARNLTPGSGGGGATSVGTSILYTDVASGNGGNGYFWYVNNTYYGGGGGGGGQATGGGYVGGSTYAAGGAGGLGGGGTGGTTNASNTVTTQATGGTANTGGGGGGACQTGNGGNGGSGIVIIAVFTVLSNQLTNSTVSSMRCLYAFMRCISTYYGPVVNIRRASDNTTSDFYADIYGNLGQSINGTGTTLSTWLTGTRGYVTTWYDQSPQSNNMVQTTAAYQPQIILNDTGGICLYLNITAPDSQLATIYNVFAFSAVTNAHMIIYAKSLTLVVNVMVCLHAHNSYSPRWLMHLPWNDGTFYYDSWGYPENSASRINSNQNIVSTGTKFVFSAYKQQAQSYNATITTGVGFNVNEYVYSNAINYSQPAARAGLNVSMNTTPSNHYVYSFSVFSKTLAGSSDELVARNYFKNKVNSITTTAPVTTSGLYTLYTFTSATSITFAYPTLINVLLVGGGGCGGNDGGGGGGGGGIIDTSFVIPAGTYTPTIGAGGVYLNTQSGTRGGDTTFYTLTAKGGGGGGSNHGATYVPRPYTNLFDGGCGGGQGATDRADQTGPGNGVQGYGGGLGSQYCGAGGGSATARGGDASGTIAGIGANGYNWSINNTTYGGGGGGGTWSGTYSAGGAGGGGGPNTAGTFYGGGGGGNNQIGYQGIAIVAVLTSSLLGNELNTYTPDPPISKFNFVKTTSTGSLSWASMGSYANLICCSSNGQYVYVWIGDSTYPFYSSNYGASFAQSTCSRTVPSWWGQIGCSYSGQYVWLASYGYVFYSNNYGVSYTTITSPVSLAVGVAVSADGTKVMIGSNSGSSSQAIAYSTNGTATTPTFTTSASVPWTTGGNFMFAYSANFEYIYTVISNNSTTTALWYTINQGTSWTSLATPWNGAGTLGLACDQTGKYVGNIAVNSGTLYYSINYGASWTTVTLLQGNYFGLQIKSSGTNVNILISGENATCGLYWGVSTDGTNFRFGTSFTSTSVTGGYRQCVLSNDFLSAYVIGGTSTTGIIYGKSTNSFKPYVLACGNGTIYITTNGTTFTTAATNLFSAVQTVYQITYGNSMYVAVGNGVNGTAYSPDLGGTWTGVPYPFGSTSSVAFGPAPGLRAVGSVFICTGNKTNGQGASGSAGNTTLAWSPDGKSWTGILSPSAIILFTGNTGGRIIYNTKLSMWIVTGVNNNGNAAQLGYSTDGINWTRLNPTAFNGGSVIALGCDYNPSTGLTVACGSASNGTTAVQTVVTSDGMTWRNSASPFGTANNQGAYAVAYGAGIFMVVGGNTNSANIIFSSSDGYTWTSVLAIVPGGSSNDTRSVIYSSTFNTWYVGTTGPNTYYSQNNGATWSTVAVPNTYYGFFTVDN